MTREKAIRRLKKLEEERAELLAVINSLDMQDIQAGAIATTADGVSYKIIEKDFERFNLVQVGEYYPQEQLKNPLPRKDMLDLLVKNNCRITI